METTGASCINLGGTPTFGLTDWGKCTIKMCEAQTAHDTIIGGSQINTCDIENRVRIEHNLYLESWKYIQFDNSTLNEKS